MIKLKRSAKHLLAVVVYYSGLLALLSRIGLLRGTWQGPMILMYHRVLEAEEMHEVFTQPGMSVTTNTFSKQLNFLSHRYRILSLKKAVSGIAEGVAFGKKTVVITFDDGWRDNYTNAFPLLKKYQIPATIFLPTDFIDSDKLFWFLQIGILFAQTCPSPARLRKIVAKSVRRMSDIKEEWDNAEQIYVGDGSADSFIESLKRYDQAKISKCIEALKEEIGPNDGAICRRRWILNWDEIREMTNRLVDFGSHGCSHQILTVMETGKAKRELEQSRAAIKKEIGMAVTLFSYPNGNYDTDLIDQVRLAGYEAAVTVGRDEQLPNEQPLYSLSRLGIHEGATAGISGRFSRAIFSCYLEGLF